MPLITAESRRTITMREAASAAGVSLNTMSEAVRRGDFPSIRLGRRVLIPRAAFERIIAGETGASSS